MEVEIRNKPAGLVFDTLRTPELRQRVVNNMVVGAVSPCCELHAVLGSNLACRSSHPKYRWRYSEKLHCTRDSVNAEGLTC